MHDILRVPYDPAHVYEINRVSDAPVLAPDGIDNVDIITPDGAQWFTSTDVNADALRLRPRLERTTKQIIDAANTRWALDSPDIAGGANG